jgi:amino acid transporter
VTPPGVTLDRAIGRLALTGLVLNSVIGSSVFGLPSVVAARLGAMSVWAWLVAALGMAFVVACFAEVASRFREAGGAYLYARAAFGRLAGIEMGWLTYLVRLTAAATNANLLVIYLAEFWPGATSRIAAPVVLALTLLPLAAANYRGVGPGIGVSTAFIVAKLIPLGLFVIAGLALGGQASGSATPHTPDAGDWLQTVLLLVFAYGGFEAALVPLGEAKDPRRDAPIALITALTVCALLYASVQVVVNATLSDPGASPRPLADAARVLAGRTGAAVLAGGALVSVYGYLAAAMLNVPRLTYAMAAQGDLPGRFATLHPRFRTPHVSVMTFAVLVWLFAASGSFLQNLTLSAVSRLLTYGAVCVALVVLRWKGARASGRIETARFRVPGGTAVAVLGLAFSLVLVARIGTGEAVLLGATLGAGLVHWAWLRR